MKAVRFHRHGGPEVLRYEDDAPDPVPGNGEVLVSVRACALNHLDLWARNGLPNVKIPLPHISGSDISGVVEWVPDGEREFEKGAEVIVNPGISCGRCEKCLLGMDNQCRFYTIVGYEVDGEAWGRWRGRACWRGNVGKELEEPGKGRKARHLRGNDRGRGSHRLKVRL